MLLVGLIVAMIVGIVAWVGGDGSECAAARAGDQNPLICSRQFDPYMQATVVTPVLLRRLHGICSLLSRRGKMDVVRQTALGQSANSRQYLGCIHHSRMGHSTEARLVTPGACF
jgi:hypothetical protein